MKRIFLLAFLLPALAMAQTKAKPKVKTVTKTKATVAAVPPKPADSFLINGDVKGYPDGTSVSLLNGQTGNSEAETTMKNGKFEFTGKSPVPDFKIILFNKQQPYITLFLDNSAIKIVGTKDAVDKSAITGSPAHKEFEDFNKLIAPYQAVFVEGAEYDSVSFTRAMNICEDFAVKHPKSFIAPLAIIRYSQISDDFARAENLYNALPAEVKSTSMGQYLTQYIATSKTNAVGTELADFTQADTTGKPVSLSSLRGKYVLVDFWASWCGPCRRENPNLVAAYNKYKSKNFTVLGVSLDKAKPAWIDAIKMDGLTWNHVSDLQGWGNAVAQQFQIGSIPQNFLIGPDGKIIGKNLRGAALERKLGRVLR